MGKDNNLDSNELELFNIEVGKKIPIFTESVERLKGVDGAFLEVNEFGQGYFFCVALANVNFMDKKSFRDDQVEMRVLQGQDGMVL